MTSAMQVTMFLMASAAGVAAIAAWLVVCARQDHRQRAVVARTRTALRRHDREQARRAPVPVTLRATAHGRHTRR